jgi:hypothetical protein
MLGYIQYLKSILSKLKLMGLFLFLLLGCETQQQTTGINVAPLRVVNVATAIELTTALAAAVAGDEIRLANGTYSGNFIINISGNSQNHGNRQ